MLGSACVAQDGSSTTPNDSANTKVQESGEARNNRADATEANKSVDKNPADYQLPETGVDDETRLNSKPKAAEDIGVDPREGEFIELDVPFTDEMNRYIKIGDYLKKGQPMMLSFNYSNCPKLCSVQLENMTLALREVADKHGLAVGDDFQVVFYQHGPE